MKRAITTLGVLGLAAFAVTAPAVADTGGASGSGPDDKIIICHAGSGSNSERFTVNSVAVPSLNGHDGHAADIIPPNDGLENGQNWDAVGQAIHLHGCVAPVDEKPPVVVPPVEEKAPVVVPPVDVPMAMPVETPLVETTVVTPVVIPPVEQPVVVPPVTVPQAAAAVVVPQQPVAAGAAMATTSLGTNQGYNAQTAVGSSGSPSWLAGIGALLAAGGAVAFRRTRRSLPTAD
jgi:hypothetical protein